MIEKKIINLIKKNKKGISLDKFINICLFNKNGYYLNSNPLGKSGDFTTAPEISQLFGEIIGLFIFYTWQKKYKNNFNLIELGPGNGILLNDILRITKSFPNFHNCINLHLIEKNNFLIKKQKNILKNKFNYVNVKWHNDFKNIVKKPSIIIANEFFDCLPINQFIKKNNKWFNKVVNFNNSENKFYYQDSIVNRKKILNELNQYNDIIVELSEEREKYFSKICKYIKQTSGSIIIIDYGYTDSIKHFTLQAFYNHKPSNLFDNIGKQDITSFVNFKKFISLAHKFKLNIEIFCSQKKFLQANGILERKNKIVKKCSNVQKKNLELGYKKLIDEQQMGSVYKFLIVSSKKKYEKL